MRRTLFAATLVAAVAGAFVVGLEAQSRAAAPGKSPAPAQPPAPVIVLETEKGAIEFETFPTDAPKSVTHVLELVRRGFYRGLRFHWVQPGIIQVGDPLTRDLSKQTSWGTGGSGQPIRVAEFSKHSFVRGTVGMAYRQGYDPESADSQFFIVKIANPGLDGKYTPIGRVVKGMDIADKVALTDVLKLVYVKGEGPK